MFLCTGWPTVQLSRHSVSNEAARLVASNNYKNNRRNLLAVMAEVQHGQGRSPFTRLQSPRPRRDRNVKKRPETEMFESETTSLVVAIIKVHALLKQNFV